MKIPKSMLGILLVIAYCTVVAFGHISVITCKGMFCDLAILFPVMPWAILLGPIWDYPPVYIILLIINASIFYYIGVGIGRLFRKIIPKKTDVQIDPHLNSDPK